MKSNLFFDCFSPPCRCTRSKWNDDLWADVGKHFISKERKRKKSSSMLRVRSKSVELRDFRGGQKVSRWWEQFVIIRLLKRSGKGPTHQQGAAIHHFSLTALACTPVTPGWPKWAVGRRRLNAISSSTTNAINKKSSSRDTQNWREIARDPLSIRREVRCTTEERIMERICSALWFALGIGWYMMEFSGCNHIWLHLYICVRDFDNKIISKLFVIINDCVFTYQHKDCTRLREKAVEEERKDEDEA